MNELAWGIAVAGVAVGIGLYRIGSGIAEAMDSWCAHERDRLRGDV